MKKLAPLFIVAAVALGACSSGGKTSATAVTTTAPASTTAVSTTAPGATSTTAPSAAATTVSGATTTRPPLTGDAVAAALNLDPAVDAPLIACVLKAVDTAGADPFGGETVEVAKREPLARDLLDCGLFESVLFKTSVQTAGITVTDAQNACIAKGVRSDDVFVKSLAGNFADTAPTGVDPADAAFNKLALGCGLSQADLDKLNAKT